MNKLKTNQSDLSSVPSVHEILDFPDVKNLVSEFGHNLVSDSVRAAQKEFRNSMIASGHKKSAKFKEEVFVDSVRRKVLKFTEKSLQPVLNLSGTILHTNLGRALLPDEAISAMTEAASQAVNLEYNILEGDRGSRDKHVEEELCRLTGAEAVTIVNNNAAAVMLVLNTLARRKEVLVSRGELVEIGGSFRLPDIMTSSGCKLREVGTTNRTHIEDFENALSSKTGLILKAYTSNYTITGFTKEVKEADVISLSRNCNIPFVVDLGSGSLIDLKNSTVALEPTPLKKLKSGVDLVTFSGDKLLGGPQCGIIAGRKNLIAKINRNAMKRAMRCDKLTIAALSAVLKLYENPEKAVKKIPTLRLLLRSKEEIKNTVDRVLPELQSHMERIAILEVVDCQSQVGSGALPNQLLPSVGIAIRLKNKKSRNGHFLSKVSEVFRKLPIPIIGRIHDNAFILDLRSLENESALLKQLEFLPKNWDF